MLQAKWNDGLLEMFRNEYIGSAPYISSEPFLCHHKLGPDDQFLVLSSDGLYQYLSNEEVVSHVEHFMENFPDGDPAQSLIEVLLSRAAKKAGIFPVSLCQFYSTPFSNLCTLFIQKFKSHNWASSWFRNLFTNTRVWYNLQKHNWRTLGPRRVWNFKETWQYLLHLCIWHNAVSVVIRVSVDSFSDSYIDSTMPAKRYVRLFLIQFQSAVTLNAELQLMFSMLHVACCSKKLTYWSNSLLTINSADSETIFSMIQKCSIILKKLTSEEGCSLFAGMELCELLEIPKGDRRKYHDDVTVMIISLEGRIWKSSGKCIWFAVPLHNFSCLF